MATRTENNGAGRQGRWRIVIWGIAVFLLLLPLVGMQFSDEVTWDAADFMIVGTMLAVAGGTCELAIRATGNVAYRAAVAVAVVAAFLLVWVNLAVGIIGDEGNPANLMFAGVLAIAIAGSFVARSEPHGMARALVATAFAQTLAGVIALAARLGSTEPSFPEAIVFLTGFFSGAWLLSAWLFRQTARAQASSVVAG